MHKIILFAFFLMTASNASSQTNRFYYQLNFKIDSTGSTKSDLMILDINKESTVFFSNNFLEIDSINTNTNSYEFPQPIFDEIVKFNKKTQDFTFIKSLSMNYYQYNSNLNINWKIENVKKKIGKNEVQKATTVFMGRMWTAWFCTSIPMPYGPYNFHGLPGLILEVYDEDSNYHFGFIQNKNFDKETNSEDVLEKFTKAFRTTVKEKDWQQLQINYYLNPLAEYKNGDAFMTKDNGDNYTLNDYRELEKQIKRQIRNYNNPIDLEKKNFYK